MPDFNNVNLIRHCQIPLARAALTPQIQRSLVNMDRIELEPKKKTSFTVFARPLGATLEEALRTRSSLAAGTPILEQMKSSPSDTCSKPRRHSPYRCIRGSSWATSWPTHLQEHNPAAACH